MNKKGQELEMLFGFIVTMLLIYWFMFNLGDNEFKSCLRECRSVNPKDYLLKEYIEYCPMNKSDIYCTIYKQDLVSNFTTREVLDIEGIESYCFDQCKPYKEG